MYKYMTLYFKYDYMNGFAIKHHTKVPNTLIWFYTHAIIGQA